MFYFVYTFLVEPKFQTDGANDIQEKILNGGFTDCLLIATHRGKLTNKAAQKFYRENRLPNNSLRKNLNIVLIGRTQLIEPEKEHFLIENPGRFFEFKPQRHKKSVPEF